MKQVLRTILFWCISINGYSQSVWFVSANTGNDSNDGTSWAQAELTLGEAAANDVTVGDTVVCVGTFTELLATSVDGTAGNYIVWIDSLRYTDGVNSTKPDTVWTAIIDGTSLCLNPTGEVFYKFIGFDFTSSTGDGVNIGNASDNWTFWQNRWSGSISNDCLDVGVASGTNEIISNLFIAGWRSMRLLSAFLSGTWTIANNTSYSSQTIESVTISGDDSPALTLELKNNIFYNTSTTNSDYAISVDPGNGTINAVDDWNNNLLEALTSNGDWFEFNGTAGSTIAAWEDSVNNYDADGATNTLNTDPSIQNPTTTAYILNTSPAAEAGVDLGFGNDIGYYQTDPASTARRRPTIIL